MKLKLISWILKITKPLSEVGWIKRVRFNLIWSTMPNEEKLVLIEKAQMGIRRFRIDQNTNKIVPSDGQDWNEH